MKYLFNISVASGNNLIKSLLLLKNDVFLSKYIDISHWQSLKKLMLFFVALTCIISEIQAENSFQLTYSTTTINRGDQAGSTVTLNISNSSGTLEAGTYQLSTPNGIYITLPSASSTASFATINAAGNTVSRSDLITFGADSKNAPRRALRDPCRPPR